MIFFNQPLYERSLKNAVLLCRFTSHYLKSVRYLFFIVTKKLLKVTPMSVFVNYPKWLCYAEFWNLLKVAVSIWSASSSVTRTSEILPPSISVEIVMASSDFSQNERKSIWSQCHRQRTPCREIDFSRNTGFFSLSFRKIFFPIQRHNIFPRKWLKYVICEDFFISFWFSKYTL